MRAWASGSGIFCSLEPSPEWIRPLPGSSREMHRCEPPPAFRSRAGARGPGLSFGTSPIKGRALSQGEAREVLFTPLRTNPHFPFIFPLTFLTFRSTKHVSASLSSPSVQVRILCLVARRLTPSQVPPSPDPRSEALSSMGRIMRLFGPSGGMSRCELLPGSSQSWRGTTAGSSCSPDPIKGEARCFSQSCLTVHTDLTRPKGRIADEDPRRRRL